MYQQINLYQPIFRRQQHVFSAFAMAKVIGIIAVALTLTYAYGIWQVSGLEAEVVLLEGREKAYAAQLARLDPTDAIQRREQLEDELRGLNETLLQRQKLVETLRDRPLGSVRGFSAQLIALARSHQEGLWLTRMVFSGASGELQLSGISLRPESIPKYLQQLGDEEAMHGQRFDTFEIERQDGGGRLHFRVSSRALNEDGMESRLAGFAL